MLVASNGKSNWLVGTILISTYFVIAMGFWAHRSENLEITRQDGTVTSTNEVAVNISLET